MKLAYYPSQKENGDSSFVALITLHIPYIRSLRPPIPSFLLGEVEGNKLELSFIPLVRLSDIEIDPHPVVFGKESEFPTSHCQPERETDHVLEIPLCFTD